MPTKLSPTADTTSQVISTYHGHPKFICSHCAAVIVGHSYPLGLDSTVTSSILPVVAGRAHKQIVLREIRPWLVSVRVFCLPAYITTENSLMHSAVNVKLGKKEDRPLLTGVHTVQDVFCVGCNERMGWFYHKAADHSQKYKEGAVKFYTSIVAMHMATEY